MTREAAAEIFERIALLLELKGENPFNTRAYKMGAEVVENHAILTWRHVQSFAGP